MSCHVANLNSTADGSGVYLRQVPADPGPARRVSSFVVSVDTTQLTRVRQHTLGSHTWSHPDLTSLSYDQIHTELAKVEDAFIKILGLKPLYFRPPYGSYNDLVLQVLSERGYKSACLPSSGRLSGPG